jgi:acetyltransferase-like isoleucine patch superfamily enzyme/putative methionine-R-sulfoxide reductase with GAF domain
MSIENHPSPSRWLRQKEAMVGTLVTTLLAWVPLSPGRVIRRLMYRSIFERIGTSVQIDPDVKFIGADNIAIGNGVKIQSGVRLNSGQNSNISIEERANIDRGVDIKAQGNGHIKIGENTFVGPYVCMAGEHISIGKCCLIGSHSGIYAINHNFGEPTRKITEQGVSYKGIVIEDDCWLGSGVRVVDGATIGQGSVIGAGAVVTKDIHPYSVAVGVPAHVIASRRSSELVDSTQKKEYICKDGSRLPILLSAALAEVEEIAELIYDEVEEATAELLHQHLALTDTVPTNLFLQTLLHQLLNCTRQVMNVDTVAVLLPIEDEQQLTVRATFGLEEEITKGIRIPIGRGFAGRIAASHQPMIVDDLATVEVVSPILRNKGIQSILGMPLQLKKERIGVFHVGTFSPRQFTRNDAQLLQLVAEHIGLVIDRLPISRPSITDGSVLVREKFPLTFSPQKLRRTIRNFHFHPLPKGFLELASPIQLSAFC